MQLDLYKRLVASLVNNKILSRPQRVQVRRFHPYRLNLWFEHHIYSQTFSSIAESRWLALSCCRVIFHCPMIVQCTIVQHLHCDGVSGTGQPLFTAQSEPVMSAYTRKRTTNKIHILCIAGGMEISTGGVLYRLLRGAVCVVRGGYVISRLGTSLSSDHGSDQWKSCVKKTKSVMYTHT